MTVLNVTIDVQLVRRLLADQFPTWADLPLKPVSSAGTDNAIYRLGDDMAVRLPRVTWATGFIEKEARWLPVLAPHLPLGVPIPVALGQPAEGYPSRWSIVEWLEGENATLDRLDDPRRAATRLGGFVAAMQSIDPTGGPAAGEQNLLRGVPLQVRDGSTREAISALTDVVDTDAATSAWEFALGLPRWDGPPVWLHGDLHSGNLLAVDGRLTAVIDFGVMGVGDPASDTIAAWWLFTGESREAFRAALPVDGDTWERGRGWALSIGVAALAYYVGANEVLAQMAKRAIEETLSDRQ